MSEDTYYNDHYTAQCYVNRPRWVPVEKGDRYLAASLSVKKGKKDESGKPQFTQQLDTTVVGTQAKAMIEALIEFLEAQPEGSRPVISATVKSGDIEPGDPYTLKKGDNKGQIVTPLRGRLVKLTHVYIDGSRFREDLDGDESHDQKVPPENETDQETSGVSTQEKSMPKEVKLSEHDPEFDVKRARLQEMGYEFDSNIWAWVAPGHDGQSTKSSGSAVVAGTVGATMNAAILFMPFSSFLF